MKILCFIDNLGSGGAQRQIVNLAISLKGKGHDVSFLTYSKGDFYDSLLEKNSIPLINVSTDSKIKRIFKCRNVIRNGNFDSVIAFLEIPALIAELSTLPFKKWKLVVGERSSSPAILTNIKIRGLRFFHLFSDYVVCNSNANKQLVSKANPLLPERKNRTIYNIYDLKALHPSKYIKQDNTDGKFHLLVAASHQKLKNYTNLASAISLLDEKDKARLAIDWYGFQNCQCYKDNVEFTNEKNLNGIVHFYPPTLEIYQKMADADAVGLFSFYEGLPNTVCEAMCLGKPVICTDVSDNKLLISNKYLVSDPKSPESIAHSLKYLLHLSKDELLNIGAENRKNAENLFDKENILNQYLDLFK